MNFAEGDRVKVVFGKNQGKTAKVIAPFDVITGCLYITLDGGKARLPYLPMELELVSNSNFPYMCYVKDAGVPRMMHQTLEIAEGEAVRLARETQKEVFVLMAVKKVIVPPAAPQWTDV